MWLAARSLVFWSVELGADDVDAQHLAAQIASLTQVATDIDAKLTVLGAGGLAGAVGLYQRMTSVVDAAGGPELDRMTTRVEELMRALEEVDRRLTALRELKALLERIDEPR